MSIALIVTRGYGNGTLTGTIPFVVTRGYSSGAAIEIDLSKAVGLESIIRLDSGVTALIRLNVGLESEINE